MKRINPKKNRHKTSRITWFGNNLHSWAMMNKFHYIKFGIIQIGVRHSHKPKSQIHPNGSFSQIQKLKNQIQTKEPKVHECSKTWKNTRAI